ncbi:MAG: hypothetical protein ACODAD_04460 [Planctomycetota bacterium]
MHRYASEAEFLRDISSVLVGIYLTAALLNFGAAYYWWGQRRRRERDWPRLAALGWLLVALLFCALLVLAAGGEPGRIRWISFSPAFRGLVDRMMGPVVLVVGAAVMLGVFYRFRGFLTHPLVAWCGLNLSLLFLGFSMPDADFAAIVMKPDHVPIVGLIYLLAFFTWLATRKAVLNDDLLGGGGGPREAAETERVLVWPDLVYIELICMVGLMVLMLVWSIAVKAPLEAEASTVVTPNPSKAPWYFLGLQELLLYFDPWMAGVVLPCLIIFGLCAIPYVDGNTKGSGYYTIEQRPLAYLTFQFGFLVLWILLMLIGTFFRGPNWSFFGFFETWDVHKVAELNNVSLAKRFWIDLLNRPLPAPAGRVGVLTQLGYIAWREVAGFVLLAGYFIASPLLLARYSKKFGAYRRQVGGGRYLITVLLMLMMLLLPIKMICRWSFNLNYFLSIPEFSLNF